MLSLFKRKYLKQNKMIERLSRLFADPKYQPISKSEIARKLRIPKKEDHLLRASISEMMSEGIIYHGKRGKITLSNRPKGLKDSKSNSSKVTKKSDGKKVDKKVTTKKKSIQKSKKQTRGKEVRGERKAVMKGQRVGGSNGGLRVGQNIEGVFKIDRGRGKVVDSKSGKEVPIFARDTGTALPDDIVGVRLEEDRPPNWKVKSGKLRNLEGGIKGKVMKVLKRSNRPLLGIYHEAGKFRYVKPEGAGLPSTVDLKGKKEKKFSDLKDGDKVLVQIASWESKFHPPKGNVIDVLGDPDGPGVDMLSLIHRHDLPMSFPEKVIEEAQAIPQQIPQEEIDQRVDWRDRLVFTIDPATAKDFDDAIAVKENKDGSWELAVHIADVSSYVKSGTALDREAYKRGNSTYLADRVIPMLPEVLSNGLCSLVPEEDRLTRCAVMVFDKNGNRKSATFEKAIICSAKRYTYEEAFEILQDKKKIECGNDYEKAVHLAWKLASKMRKNRFSRGCLDMEFPEVSVELDELGKAIGIKKSDHDISHQLVEECMLAANEAVAAELKKRGAPSIYRVHDDPDKDRLFDLREFLGAHGIKVGDLSQRSEMQKALEASRGRPDEHAIQIAILRSLRRAEYIADPLGHYGLATPDYTHFTSPIRRYADLIVHRVLYAEKGKGGERTPDYATMGEIGKHISTTERASSDAESESQKMKQMEYFLTVLEDDPDQVFRASIVSVERMGIFVELEDNYFRGLIPSRELTLNFERYDNARREYVSKGRGKKRLRAGGEIEVSVMKIDEELYRLDFRLESIL